MKNIENKRKNYSEGEADGLPPLAIGNFTESQNPMFQRTIILDPIPNRKATYPHMRQNIGRSTSTSFRPLDIRLSEESIVSAESQHLESASMRARSGKVGSALSLSSAPNFKSLRGRIVYIGFLFLGLGTLLPWNFFITADSYWQYKFRNVTDENWIQDGKTSLQKLYTPMQVCLSQFTNFIFLFVNAVFSHVIPQRVRLLVSLLVMILFFTLTTALVKIDSDNWQQGLFGITMVIIVIMNASGAIFQGGLYGIAGMFPQAVINAVGIGQALGGVFASLSRIGSIYFGVDDVTSAFIYFLIAVIVMVFTLLEYLYVSSTKHFKYYTTCHILGEDNRRPITRVPNQTLSNLLKEHFKIFKKIWPLAISVCFIFLVTLSVFPVINVRVTSTSNNEVWANKYFQPVVTFLLFNVGDYLGRQFAEWILWPRRGSRILYALVFIRVAFIPLLILCNHDPSSTIPSVFNDDAWYISFMAVFAFSSGYCSSLCMMYAPKLVEESESEKAGSMMAAMIGLGLLIGAMASFGFALVVS